MPPIHPAYLERERQRWLRHDAHRFLRPDWRRYVQSGSELAAYYESIEQKYRPDQPRVPAGNPDGGQWADEGDQAEQTEQVQFREDQRSLSSGRLIQAGGQDLGSFGNGVSIAKGPNITHQEKFDPVTGVTTLSFTGVGMVVVDEKDGNVVTGTAYDVGTPTRPDAGLNITVDRDGNVRTYPTFGS